ncbi:MAG: hypothetical protein WD708_05415 [Kiritimatiellia bacterium]
MKLQLRKPTWTEKRDSIRLELECPVSYRTVTSSLGIFKKVSKPMSGMLLKPSMRGLRLLTSEAVPKETMVHITVEMTRLGYDRSYEVHGKVVWTDYSAKTKGFEQGVCLLDSGPDSKRWKKYIMECLQSTDRNWRGK